MTDTIANQNGGFKPQDSNASGPSSTSTPNSDPPANNKTGPPKRLPSKRVKNNPNNKAGSATISTGNENTVPKAKGEVGNATPDADATKKRKKKKKKKKKKTNPTDGAGDAHAIEVAGEKTQEPQKDEPEIVPPIVDGEETPRGKEGKLSRKQRRKLKTSQGGPVSGTGIIDSETTATGSQPDNSALLAGAPVENLEASLSTPKSPENVNEEDPVPALEEEMTTANRDIALDEVDTYDSNAKSVEAAPRKEEKAETKTKAASRDVVVETQVDHKEKTSIAYEDDNTGKKDDCECSGCMIS